MSTRERGTPRPAPGRGRGHVDRAGRGRVRHSRRGPGARDPDEAPTAVTVTIARIPDGDTVDVHRAGRTERVRLLGVDAPETAHGQAAQCGANHALRDLLGHGKVVVLTLDDTAGRTDRYGHTLGYLGIDGRDAGLALIQAGLAADWHPTGTPTPTQIPHLRRRATPPLLARDRGQPAEAWADDNRRGDGPGARRITLDAGRPGHARRRLALLAQEREQYCRRAAPSSGQNKQPHRPHRITRPLRADRPMTKAR